MKRAAKKAIMNAIRNTQYAILTSALLTLFVCGLIFAAEKLEVDGDLEIQSTQSGTTPLRHGLIFKPQSSEPTPGVQGQVYYDKEDKGFLYRNNSTWMPMGSGPSAQDKYVATKIVAAYNSLGSTVDGSPPNGPPCTNCCAGDGSACNNPKADTGYTCDGIDDQQTINNAITEVGNQGGGAVYLLEGTYNIAKAAGFNDGIILNKDNVALIGAGASTVLVAAASSQPNYLIYIPNNYALVSQLRLSAANTLNGGILLAGNDSKIDKVWFESKASINISSSGSRNVISNCDFSNMGDLEDIIYISGSSNRVYNNLVSDVPKTGINIQGANNIIDGNNFSHSSGGEKSLILVYGPQANANLINANMFENALPDVDVGGLCLGSSSAQIGPSANIITNNHFDNCGGACYYQAAPYNLPASCTGTVGLCTADSNIVANNLIYKGNINLGVTEAVSYYTQNNLISANLIYDIPGSSGTGISYQGDTKTKTNQFSFNHISNPTGTVQDTGIKGLNTDAGDTYIMGNYLDHFTLATPLATSAGTNTGAKYTQREKITMERSAVYTVPAAAPNNIIYPLGYPNGSGTLVSSTNYIPVKGSVSGGQEAFIANGSADGDVLILEGTDDSYYIYITFYDYYVSANYTRELKKK